MTASLLNAWITFKANICQNLNFRFGKGARLRNIIIFLKSAHLFVLYSSYQRKGNHEYKIKLYFYNIQIVGKQIVSSIAHTLNIIWQDLNKITEKSQKKNLIIREKTNLNSTCLPSCSSSTVAVSASVSVRQQRVQSRPNFSLTSE